MKFKKTIILSSILLIATGCNNVNQKYSISMMRNFDYKVESDVLNLELNNTRLFNLVDNNYEVAVLFYSTTCSLCKSAIENVGKYMKEHQTQIYFYDISKNDTTLLFSHFPDLANGFISPSLSLFKNKNVVYTLNDSKLDNYRNFSSVFKNHYSFNNLYTLTTNEALTSYLEDNDKTYIITTSSSDNDLLKRAYEKISNIEENILVLDSYYAKDEVFASLDEYFNIDYSSDNLFAYIDKNNQTKTAEKY